MWRQATVAGTVGKVSAEDSDAYFDSRDRGSQIGAWASPQTEVVPDRAWLEQRVAEFERRFEGQPVPRPPHWGGFRLRPDTIDFWYSQPDRLHDRFRFTRRADDGWSVSRLAP
jgi:pyridoxamine 5'-phosphate oxidase